MRIESTVHDEEQYKDLLRNLRQGVYRDGRNGGTYSLFGHQSRYDLAKGFPLLTTKRVHLKSVIVELLWFLKGDTNVKYLHDHGVTIWDEWMDGETGDLGPVYGKQWRSWAAPNGQVIDQIADVVHGLKTNPYGRRHVVSAWNPSDVEDMALPPCHCLFQFYVAPDAQGVERLSCQLYQRSADVFLGVPFNIASYALLTMMVAKEVGLEPGEFIHTLGDYHLYDDHVDQAELQLTRKPRPFPTMVLADGKGLFDYTPDDFTLVSYDPHPHIPAKVRK